MANSNSTTNPTGGAEARRCTTQPALHDNVMEAALSPANLHQAWRRVKSNRGAPGIDGLRIEDFPAYAREHWPAIRQRLNDGSYQPQPVRRITIPKPDGGERALGIPAVVDRVIQQAIAQVMTPIFDPEFSESSYGFRPKRSAHGALKQVKADIQAGYRIAVDLDLAKFFDNVDHDILMARVARRISDKRLLALIGRYLRAGVLINDSIQPSELGTPQGGPLSPLLSNILLDELDKELEKRGHTFCRYADDCNIYVATKASGQRVMVSITSFLSQRLKLTVNQAKSAVDRPWRRTFLGYTMSWHPKARLKVGEKAITKFKDTLRKICKYGRGWSMTRTITEANPKLRGWVNYFCLAGNTMIFQELDSWFRRKLRAILWRQWKRNKTRATNLIKLGLSSDASWRYVRTQRGPWASAGTNVMHRVLKNSYFENLGLLSLQEQYLRLARVS